MPKPGRFFNGVELGFGIMRDGVDASSVGTLPGRRPAVHRVFAGVESMVERVRVVGVGAGVGAVGVGRWLELFQRRFIALWRSHIIGNAR